MAQATMERAAPLNERLQKATKENMVEVAPGRYAPADPQIPVAEYTVARWHKNGDGTWRAVPFKEPFLRLDQRLATLLGFNSRGWNTIRRLGRAGYVEIIQIAPGTSLINLDSWFNHLRRCAENPEIWDRGGKDLKAYQAAIE